jgi:hypothetical protein
MIHRNNTKLCLIIYQNSLASSQVNHVGSNNGSIFSTFREGKVPTFLSNSLIFYFLFHLFPPNFLYLFTLSLFICLKLPQRYNLKVENIYPSNNYCDKKIPTTITSLMPLGSVSSMTVDNTPVAKKYIVRSYGKMITEIHSPIFINFLEWSLKLQNVN